MKNKNKVMSAALAGMLLFSSACEKEFLDINANPNNPADATVELVLPTAQAYIAYTMGNQYQVIGGIFSQYWTQGSTASQYLDYDAYRINATDSDRPWAQLYSGALNDLKFVETRAREEEKPYYEGISLTLQAYVYQYLTDIYGDVPFSQSLQGESGITAPGYDKQEDVYKGMIAMVDNALALFNEESDAAPGADDLIYHGDIFQWWKFANTLKLKLLVRQSEVNPAAAQAGIMSLDTSGALFLEEGDDATVQFSTTTFNTNPLYSHISALNFTPNLMASKTSIDYLLSTSDPRIDVYYDPASTGHIGQVQGDAPNIDPPSNDFSHPSETVTGPTTPVILMSATESQFLQAEATARGWMTSMGTDQDLYEAGVRASFAFWGLSSEDADSLLAHPSVAYPAAGSVDDKVKAIFIQKWVAMNSTQTIEAWIEHRRIYAQSDANQFLKPSVESVLAENQLPARLVYPSDELTRNPNVPASKLTDRVWWDVQ